MSKPKMLYASPFWPKESGISNYSSYMVQALRPHFDITLLADGYTVEDELLRDLPVVQYQRGERYPGYDVILYNFGNNPYFHAYMLDALRDNPGFVILHDLSLYYLTVGVAQREGDPLGEIYAQAGLPGFQLLKESLYRDPNPDLLQHKDLAAELLLNREVIDRARGVLIHSHYTGQKIRALDAHKPILEIKHVQSLQKEYLLSDDAEVKRCIGQAFGIPEDAFVLLAAGYIAPTKQNVLTCQAVKLYNARHDTKIYYLMAGDGGDADAYLDTYCRKTGFLSEEMFARALQRADVVFNLRYPTNGETSGTLIQALGLGKPCVTTAIGWFDELPDDAVIKVAPDVTAEELARMMDAWRPDSLAALGKRAHAYFAREYVPEKIAREIKGFLLGA